MLAGKVNVGIKTILSNANWISVDIVKLLCNGIVTDGLCTGLQNFIGVETTSVNGGEGIEE